MPIQRLIFPLLYKSVTTFSGPLWSIADGISLNTIYDEDFGPIYSCEREECRAIISPTTKCIYVLNPDEDNPLQFAKHTATKLKFVLNTFSTGVGVVLPYGFITNTARKTKLVETLDLEAITNLHVVLSNSYKIRAKTEKGTISQYYKIVNEACDKHSSLYFTLERFCSSIMRSVPLDRIVDITIALESLISGKEELRYKFSLFNSLIAEGGVDDRLSAFSMLRDLYDARSAIVHGDVESKETKKVIDRIEENWDEVMRLARSAINYYVLFLSVNTKADWDLHVKHLVFGKAGRIV